MDATSESQSIFSCFSLITVAVAFFEFCNADTTNLSKPFRNICIPISSHEEVEELKRRDGRREEHVFFRNRIFSFSIRLLEAS